MFRERQKVKRDVQLAIMVLVSKETVILQSECSVCSSWIRADIHCYTIPPSHDSHLNAASFDPA